MGKGCVAVPDVRASTPGIQTHGEASTDAGGSTEMSLMAAAHQAARAFCTGASFKFQTLLAPFYEITDVCLIIRMCKYEYDTWNLSCGNVFFLYFFTVFLC